MFAISEMMERIKGSERSQSISSAPKGAILLNRGEPDFSTPAHIQEAACRAMENNFTHYGSSRGDEELREAICLSLYRDFGVERKPDEVLVTAGGIAAIHTIVATYLNPGDEALVMDPGYSAYAECIRLFGGKPVFVPLTETFHIDFDALKKRITERSKFIFIANPSNPTGVVLTEEEIHGLAKVAEENELILIVDEVYHKLVYEGINHFSVCQVEEIKDRSILLNSFSKTYAMTGWRVGYLVTGSEIIRDLELFHKTILICVNTVAQKACAAALKGPQDCVQQMILQYDKRRKVVDRALRGMPGVDVSPCEGAFYFFPRFAHKKTSREMMQFLAAKGVMVRSGTEFGERGQSRIRISFTTSMELLEEGLARMKKALRELE